MAWLLLCIAGLLEIAFAFSMKASEGFTRLVPGLLTVATGLSSVFLLSLALRTLPLGSGYAVWTGIGAAGTAILGMAMLGDSAAPSRVLCIVLILAGVVGLKLVPDLNAYIDAQLAAHGLTEDRLALVGFSQGTMMALHVGPRRGNRLAGIVGYSGMLADPDALGAEVVTKPPVLLAHGDADDVLPVYALHQAQDRLKALDFEVEAHISRGLGHSLDDQGLQLGARFLAGRLG
jgi:multidrug transporter EmrE-like cation transporter